MASPPINPEIRLLESARITRALRENGVEVDSVFDLVNHPRDWDKSIPVLLAILPTVNEAWMKQGVVRALSIPAAKQLALRPMLNEFTAIPGGDATGYKWAVGNALEVLADDTVFEEIAAICLDKSHGESREMVVLALAKMKNPKAVEVAEQLLDDEEVAGHALIVLRKKGATKSREKIEQFLNHPKTWYRTEARKALAKFDKIEAKARNA